MILYISEWLGVIAITWALKLIPSFQFRPVGFVYPRREGITSLSLYSGMLLVAVVMVTTPSRSNLVAPEGVPDDIWIHLLVGVMGLLAFGLSLLLRRQPLLSVGWNRKRIVDAVRLAFVLALLAVFLRGKAFAIANGFTGNESMMLLVWLGIALTEETIFRGFIQLRLNYWMGSRYGWLATALLYVLWTVPFYIHSPQLLAYKLLFTAFQALVLGWLMQKCGHVLPVFIYRAISEWLVFAV